MNPWPISMELPVVSTSLRSVCPRASPWCPSMADDNYSICSPGRSPRRGRRLNRRFLKPLRIKLSLENDWNPSGRDDRNRYGDSSLLEVSEFVEVVGIGSRKDSVLGFCLNSPLCSSSLRFWHILMNDSMKVLLQQKVLRKDTTPRIMEVPVAWHSCSKAVILVASATYGSDHITAIDILETVKSANGLSVGIILMPFSFEGRKRQNEVKELAEKLQEHTNFCIVVDTDALLKKDLVTLDEALKTANNAVLMAIKAIFVLSSDMCKKLLDQPDTSIKEIIVPEVVKILERYKEAKIGFGAGYNMKTSILRAMYDCPFLSVAVKDLDGILICVLASSDVISSSDVSAFLHTFRQTTECMGEIVISTVHEPNLEPNQLLTTIIAVGYAGKKAPQKMNIFSKLAHQFPFIFRLVRGKKYSHTDETQKHCSAEDLHLPEAINSGDCGDLPSANAEIQTLFSNDDDELNYLRDCDNSSEQSEVEFLEFSANSSTLDEPDAEGPAPFQKDPLISRNLGPGYQVPMAWSSGRANDTVATPVLDNQSIYKLPVGVKLSEELKDSSITSTIMHNPQNITEITLPDTSFEAVMDLYKNTSTQITGNSGNVSKKQGVLSVRAASMLEAERDSQKKWSPIMEMEYRGGIYRGRCQGGLPEGKGCLSLADGSIYDGMWRYGKRAGVGTFYFSNGDIFQGSWRDDVMHGKGWFYFHTGDRWFSNFWKGKANGEGRFYSNDGDIFLVVFKMDGVMATSFVSMSMEQDALKFGMKAFL